MASAALLNLPPEVLRLILSHFCLHCRGSLKEPFWAKEEAKHEQLKSHARDRHTLFSLCLVSRRIKDAAQEILYHELFLGYASLKHPPDSRWVWRLTIFIRTIATRPDLAALVKTVFFHPTMQLTTLIELAWIAMRHVANALQVDLVKVWEQRSLDERERSQGPSETRNAFRQKLHLGQLDSPDLETRLQLAQALAPELIAVVLALLPNLKHLILKSPLTRDVPPAALGALGVTRLPLRTLVVTNDMPIYLSSLTPDLESLTLDNVTKLVPFDFPRLKSFCLKGYSIKKHHFAQMVDSCPQSLSSFAFECAPYSSTLWHNPSEFIVHPCDAIRPLSKFHDTLKLLYLDIRSATLEQETAVDPFPSLKHFKVLEELFLTTNAILDFKSQELDEQSLVNILPLNIVSLIMAGCPPPPERLRAGLLGLAEHKRGNPMRFHQLKSVRCDVKQVCHDSCVKEALWEVGVDLAYEEFPRRGWTYSDT